MGTNVIKNKRELKKLLLNKNDDDDNLETNKNKMTNINLLENTIEINRKNKRKKIKTRVEKN